MLNGGGVIKRIQGRIEDYIVCKDGTRLKRLGFIMKEATRVKASQLVQERAGKVKVLVIPEEGFGSEDRNRIISALIARVGTDNLDVELIETTMDKLVTTNSGKFKYIINFIRE